MTQKPNVPKIVFAGSPNVGKSSIVAKIMSNNSFTGEPTVGAAYCRKKFVKNGKATEFDIWDTAGQDRYNSLSSLYFRSAAYCILVFDLADYDSFDKVKTKWRVLAELANTPGYDDNVINKPQYILVGNKQDLGNWKVPRHEIEEYIAETGYIGYIETSAYSGFGIDNLCNLLLEHEPAIIETYPTVQLDLDLQPVSQCKCG